MTEGELKKQLKRELMRGIYRKPDSVVIDTVVDEAKKDIPQVIYNDTAKGTFFIMKLPTHDIIIGFKSNTAYKDIEELKKGFNKFKMWFGDSS